MDEKKVERMAQNLAKISASPEASVRMAAQVGYRLIQAFVIGLLVGGVLGFVICKMVAG
jgi:F0F1-type ATP synthase assembly protein I